MAKISAALVLAASGFNHLGDDLKSMESETDKKPTSQNQMQNQIEKGQAPKKIDRVDPPDPGNPKPHIHFGENEAALNVDGTWHTGKPHPVITKKISEWILKNRWNLPIE